MSLVFVQTGKFHLPYWGSVLCVLAMASSCNGRVRGDGEKPPGNSPTTEAGGGSTSSRASVGGINAGGADAAGGFPSRDQWGLAGAIGDEPFTGSCRDKACPDCRESYREDFNSDPDESLANWCGHLVALPLSAYWTVDACPREGVLGICVEPEDYIAHFSYSGGGRDTAAIQQQCEEAGWVFVER